MPILLPEDYAFPLPKMHRVRQSFKVSPQIQIHDTIEAEFQKEKIRKSIRPGARVAVAVGSRGIHGIADIVKDTVDQLKSLGADPFIVSAMGSHGGGREEGQREVLASYGITEEAMGVEVITKVDVVTLGSTTKGFTVYFDKTAYEADAVIPINRIKVHTDFVAKIQSGLCKMLVIGLGNHIGCSAIHEEEFEHFGEIILESAQIIMDNVYIPFGIGIIENSRDKTCHLEAIPSENLIEREVELVQYAIENMPKLMIRDIDVLIIQEIGKDISGNGFDPNIVGKSLILKEYILPVPKVDKMILNDLSEKTHGNAVGIGIFDVTTRKVFDQLDLESMYANDIAIKCLDDCKIPLVAADETEALLVAIKCLRNVEKDQLKIVKIQNTLDLEHIYVSDALLDEIRANPMQELVGDHTTE
ncbi:MAG: lactate racemase domain-containing protein [Tissierellia bacterium]|nr:lactate racemase domain-containing protein [Tissierellia bacterium]